MSWIRYGGGGSKKQKSFVDNTYIQLHQGETDVKQNLVKIITNTQNISTIRFQVWASNGYWGGGAYITLNGTTVASGTQVLDFTVTNILDNSRIVVNSGLSRADNPATLYIKIVSFE